MKVTATRLTSGRVAGAGTQTLKDIMIIYTTCMACESRVEIEHSLATPIHDECRPVDGRVHPKAPPIDHLVERFMDAVLSGDNVLADALEAQIEHVQQYRDMQRAALAYASMGWKVLPLKPGKKTPATRHGVNDATCDLDQIRHWWGTSPAMNIGLATGRVFDVVDVDPPRGHESLTRLDSCGGIPDVHGIVHTPSGGLHLYVEADKDAGNLAGSIAPGLDYRGAGGYVVAAPSTVGEFSWRWLSKPSPVLQAARAGSVA